MDKNELLLMDGKKVMQRWREYFEKISTEVFAHPPVPEAPLIFGPMLAITIQQHMDALKCMKPGKVTGPYDVAAELWNWQSWNSAEWLTMFFNEVIAEKRAPAGWRRSTTIPMWKGRVAR